MEKASQSLITSRIVWISLTFSTLLYGFILWTNGKLNSLSIPESYSPLEVLALISGTLLFVTFAIHEKKIKTESNMDKRFTWYVLCWALHESMVVLAFMATFISEDPHALVYILNLTLAIFGNVITFPRGANDLPFSKGKTSQK